MFVCVSFQVKETLLFFEVKRPTLTVRKFSQKGFDALGKKNNIHAKILQWRVPDFRKSKPPDGRVGNQ